MVAHKHVCGCGNIMVAHKRVCGCGNIVAAHKCVHIWMIVHAQTHPHSNLILCV